MPSLYNRRMRVSAIGGTSFTLTPILGIGASGALVDGGIAAGDGDISSGISTVVINSAGAPDTNFARHVNQIAIVSIEMEN